MNLDTQFKLVNFLYWIVIVMCVAYGVETDNWTMWVAFFLAAMADISKTKNIRVWERYNISQEKKETK